MKGRNAHWWKWKTSEHSSESKTWAVVKIITPLPWMQLISFSPQVKCLNVSNISEKVNCSYRQIHEKDILVFVLNIKGIGQSNIHEIISCETFVWWNASSANLVCEIKQFIVVQLLQDCNCKKQIHVYKTLSERHGKVERKALGWQYAGAKQLSFYSLTFLTLTYVPTVSIFFSFHPFSHWTYSLLQTIRRLHSTRFGLASALSLVFSAC